MNESISRFFFLEKEIIYRSCGPERIAGGLRGRGMYWTTGNDPRYGGGGHLKSTTFKVKPGVQLSFMSGGTLLEKKPCEKLR